MNRQPTSPSDLLLSRTLSSPLYVLRGGQFIWNNRSLWKYAAAPLAISAAVLGISYVILYRLFLRMVVSFKGAEWYWQVPYYLVTVIVAVLLLVIVFFLFTRLASTVAAPFNDLISERTEALVTGRTAVNCLLPHLSRTRAGLLGIQ
ncbi:MAG: EI24 domain-containing protein [Deltaproteobacteria bacterium]|nr:EI24 domain-containing protein [Deltaproteobacteria bacterium]